MEYINAASFPSGLDNEIKTVNKGFYLASSELIYAFYKEVQTWALENGYELRYGNDNNNNSIDSKYPVVHVSWRDAIVFCNAFTDYYNNFIGDKKLNFVYTSDSEYKNPIKIAPKDERLFLNEGEIDNPYVNTNANGFRLPTSLEWELAARYRGNNYIQGSIEVPINSRVFWSPANYISGAGKDYLDEEESSKYAVFMKSNDSISVSRISLVKTKKPNFYKIYDMSGNVFEWVFDWNDKKDKRIIKGGAFSYLSEFATVSYDSYYFPYKEKYEIGFRVARNL